MNRREKLAIYIPFAVLTIGILTVSFLQSGASINTGLFLLLFGIGLINILMVFGFSRVLRTDKQKASKLKKQTMDKLMKQSSGDFYLGSSYSPSKSTNPNQKKSCIECGFISPPNNKYCEECGVKLW